MLAKIIVWGANRSDAITRMTRCLNEIDITGVKTNLELQKKIVANAFYRRGEISTDFLVRRVLGNGNL
jgi:acetyl-CoA carboxylase biotin carboxylase subunit